MLSLFSRFLKEENMGHHLNEEGVDPPQHISLFWGCSFLVKCDEIFRMSCKSNRTVNPCNLFLALAFMVLLNWQIPIVSGSAETVVGFRGVFSLPYSRNSVSSSKSRSFSQSLPTVKNDLSSSPPPVINFQKPEISLSVIHFEYGAVVSSKVLLQYTDSNVTKIIDEEEILGENDVEGDEDETHGFRPGERTGVPVQPLVIHRVLRLECRSNFPVEFGYEGCGTPFNITTKSFRHIKNFTELSSYTYSTFLDFSSNEERHTGLYLCGPVRNASVNATQTLSEAPVTSFRLFVKGTDLFFSKKNETITLEQGATSFLVPCPISSPAAYSQVKLYHVGRNEMVPALFDMNKGFHVFVKHGDRGLIDAAGNYVCKDDHGRSSPHYKVVVPKDLYSRVTPNVNYIRVANGKSQIFKCESKMGNVTLTFSGDRQPRPPRKVNSELNESSEYPYVAMYEVNPMEILVEHTVINCVSVEDGTIIHTWEYSTYADVSISKFYFDGNKRYQDARYVCCSDSYYKPKLEYVLCRTETECEIKKRILDEEGSELKESILEEYALRVAYLNNTCVSFQPHFKHTLQNGLLRCTVHGITKKVHRDYMYYFNPYRVYQAFTDDRFDHLKVITSDSIMKMSKTPSKNTLIGQRTRFLCYFSEFFLSNGIVWSLEMKNGSISYFDQSDNLHLGNTSFSQIEITLDNTDVSVIRCHAPVRASPYEWRNLSGPIFVRDHPKIQATWTTAEGIVEKTLSGNLSESRNLILEEPLIPNNGNGFVVLECNASFPVDWIYTGEGLPELDFQAMRHTEKLLTNFRSYNYSAKLKFFKINKQIVGRYSCISANREFGHRGKEEDLKADFNVFVPGESIFTNQNNQTVRVWEYRDSTVLPCTVTDPRVNVTLHKLNNDTNSWESVDPDKSLEYSPLSGFVLSRNVTKTLYGTYRCEAVCNKTSTTHVSGVFSVVLPFDPATRLTPFQKQVKIYSNETQLFKCEAKEEVTLKFSDLVDREIIYETDPTSQFPFSAAYETEIDEFSNFTIINCTIKHPKGDEDTKKVLHTWEFYPDDPNFIDSFTFDNTTGYLTCCSKPYRDPVFEWMNCSSISECFIRQSACLKQNKCQSAHTFQTGEVDYSKKDQGCIAMSITDKPQGFIRCVVSGVHKIVTQAYMYYYNKAENYEIHDGYFLAPKVFEKFTVPHDKIMKIGMDQTEKHENITVGETVKFFCSASKFFCGAEIRWAFERKNGTVDYFFGKDLKRYSEVESEMAMTFEDSDWQRVYCFAPNWSEYYGWRNVSLPLLFNK